YFVHHHSVFDYLREIVLEHENDDVQFNIDHIDGHADLGSGDEGYLYICGYRSNPMWPFLAKFNDNGSIERYRILKIYGNVLFRYMGLITVDKAGYAYFLTTRTVNQPNSSSLSNVSPVLLKIAPNSTIVWEKIIGVAVNITWFYSINYMHDDTILILGKSPSNEIVLTKLTLNGEIIWYMMT
ncbi:MAG: hypothetical protein ACTSSP_12170, partial [Candidatus Asgardarchaeia archaeon]